MKVSVIIPVYGVRQWIAECLESVLLQSFTDWECVLVNDCTKDDSMDVVEELLARYPTSEVQKVRIVELEENSGLSVARNRGIEACLGEWIFMLDGDDKFASHMALNQMVAQVEASDLPLDWVQGNFLRVSPAKTWNTTYYDPSNPFFDRARIEQEFSKLNFTNATNKLIRRNFLVNNNLWFTPGLIFEDTLWSIQAYGYVSRVATIAPLTYYHNIRESSITTSSFTTKKIDSLLQIISQSISLGALKDKNISSRTVINTLYLINNLALTSFDKPYKEDVLKRLDSTTVFALKPELAALSPLNGLLSVAFWLNSAKCRMLWLTMYLFCYMWCNVIIHKIHFKGGV